jgi:hypothetical protein
VGQQLAVPYVEWLVADQQAKDLAIGDIDDGLAGLRISIAGLGVRQRPDFVEGIQIGAGQAVRLALVEVADPAGSRGPATVRRGRLPG